MLSINMSSGPHRISPASVGFPRDFPQLAIQASALEVVTENSIKSLKLVSLLQGYPHQVVVVLKRSLLSVLIPSIYVTLPRQLSWLINVKHDDMPINGMKIVQTGLYNSKHLSSFVSGLVQQRPDLVTSSLRRLIVGLEISVTVEYHPAVPVDCMVVTVVPPQVVHIKVGSVEAYTLVFTTYHRGSKPGDAIKIRVGDSRSSHCITIEWPSFVDPAIVERSIRSPLSDLSAFMNMASSDIIFELKKALRRVVLVPKNERLELDEDSFEKLEVEDTELDVLNEYAASIGLSSHDWEQRSASIASISDGRNEDTLADDQEAGPDDEVFDSDAENQGPNRS